MKIALCMMALSLTWNAKAQDSWSSQSTTRHGPPAERKVEGSSNILATRPWSFGVFAAGGFAPDYRFSERIISPYGTAEWVAPLKLQLYNAGLIAGRVLTKPAGYSLLRGQFELGAELLPYWQAHYPPQVLRYNTGGSTGLLNGQDRFGLSVTPLLCRWDFQGTKRLVPWVQLGGGLLWTNHKFPQYPTRTLDSSVINFTPQVGFGTNIFIRPQQSLFVGVNAIHISNASLGDSNPGVNITVQLRIGYLWWK